MPSNPTFFDALGCAAIGVLGGVFRVPSVLSAVCCSSCSETPNHLVLGGEGKGSVWKPMNYECRTHKLFRSLTIIVQEDASKQLNLQELPSLLIGTFSGMG